MHGMFVARRKTMNKMMLDGALTLTVIEDGEFPCELNNIESTTALLTTRGKDHDLTIDGITELMEALYQARATLRMRRINLELPALLEVFKPKMQEYLEPCDELHIDIEPSEDDVLILVPVNHSVDETIKRMEKFEEWWLDHEYPVAFNVVIDLDYRS